MALSGIVNAAKGAIGPVAGDIGNFVKANNPLAGFLGGVRPGNISDFKSQMSTPALTTQFDVVIQLPFAVKNYIKDNFEDDIDVNRAVEGLRFKIEAAELPGRSIQTAEHKYYGPVNKIAYGTTYIDTTFTVVNSSDYAETRIFQLWQDYISGQHRVNNFHPDSGANFNMHYFRDYTSGSVIINAYDMTTKKMKSVSLVDAFPLTVSPIQMNWSGDNVAKTQITMTYRFTKDLVQYKADRTFANALEKIQKVKNLIPKDGKPSSFFKGAAVQAGQAIPGIAKIL